MPPTNELEIALHDVAFELEALLANARAKHPSLRGSLAVAGAMVGHGLGHFVAAGMTDDQIIAAVRLIIDEIRSLAAPR